MASGTNGSLVLGVRVASDVQRQWQRWLAPQVQPFFVDSLSRWPKSGAPAWSAELHDTYARWRVDPSLEVVWLDEATFSELSRPERVVLVSAQAGSRRGAVPSVRRWADLLDPGLVRSQADGHRFVWWPSLVAKHPRRILSRVAAAAPDGVAPPALPSFHARIGRSTWNRCAALLPDAWRIAGSFAGSSGPNCFGTVMAAAGVPDTEREQVVEAQFLPWVHATCRPGGRDEDPGTVLVWRNAAGLPVHAAVTIGDGWALEKASQEWWTPRAIRTVKDVIRTSRSRGHHLERHRITRPGNLR